MSGFQTIITNNTIKKIYALGDLHGDIMSLIIMLRDCCKVIRKKPITGSSSSSSSTIETGEEIELKDTINVLNQPSPIKDKGNLIIDLDIWKDNADLNYEWIANDTYVVLCGDLIDNARGLPNDGFFPLEEIKLLMFINKLNEQALAKNSKIIKIIGNHDFANLIFNSSLHHINPDLNNFVGRYVNSYHNSKDNIYIIKFNNEYFNRGNFFGKKNGGRKLYLENGGCGFMCRINDWIFVHGSIANKLYQTTLTKITSFNNNFNLFLENHDFTSSGFDPRNPEHMNNLIAGYIYFGKTKNDVNLILNYLNDSKELLNDRSLGEIIAEEGNPEYCNNLVERLAKLCDRNTCDISNTRIVIAHCIQSPNINYTNLVNESFTNLEDQNNITQTLTQPVQRKLFEFPNYNNKNGHIYGITTGCSINGDINNPKLFRIDVGSSKAFDSYKDQPFSEATPNGAIYQHLLAHTPQVLSIDLILSSSSSSTSNVFNYDVKIIRSTIENTLKYQNRILSKDKQNQIIQIRDNAISKPNSNKIILNNGEYPFSGFVTFKNFGEAPSFTGSTGDSTPPSFSRLIGNPLALSSSGSTNNQQEARDARDNVGSKKPRQEGGAIAYRKSEASDQYYLKYLKYKKKYFDLKNIKTKF
jgi:hypothetical protein